MQIKSKAAAALILFALLLLAMAGRLDLLVILIPLAGILAYGITRFPHDKSGMTRGLK